MDISWDNPETHCEIEISPRFRRFLEQRITDLECNAASDEARILNLQNPDHIRRQKQLVAAELAEAGRMRRFLENSGTRLSRSLTVL